MAFMEHVRTCREIMSAPDNEIDVYWPFGFPRDILVYCKYFAAAGLSSQIPRPRTLPLPVRKSVFATLVPLYAEPDDATLNEPGVEEEAKEAEESDEAKETEESNEAKEAEEANEAKEAEESKDANDAEEAKEVQPPPRCYGAPPPGYAAPPPSYGAGINVYRAMMDMAMAKNPHRPAKKSQRRPARLCAEHPKPKRRNIEIEMKSAQVELLPQVQTSIGGVGMATHIIRSLVSGFGNYSHNKHCRGLNCSMLVSRTFGTKRYVSIFPRYKGLSSSIPHNGVLAMAMQVMLISTVHITKGVVTSTRIQATATEYLKVNTTKLYSAVRTGILPLVAAMLDSGIAADSK